MLLFFSPNTNLFPQNLTIHGDKNAKVYQGLHEWIQGRMGKASNTGKVNFSVLLRVPTMRRQQSYKPALKASLTTSTLIRSRIIMHHFAPKTNWFLVQISLVDQGYGDQTGPQKEDEFCSSTLISGNNKSLQLNNNIWAKQSRWQLACCGLHWYLLRKALK